jgi:hypothetical protein
MNHFTYSPLYDGFMFILTAGYCFDINGKLRSDDLPPTTSCDWMTNSQRKAQGFRAISWWRSVTRHDHGNQRKRWSLFSKLYHWGHATIVHIAHNSTRRIERKKLHLLQRNDIGKMKRPLPDYGQKTVQKVLHHLYDMSKLQLIVTYCTQFVHTSKHIGAYVLIHKRLLYWYSFYSAHV